MSMRSVQTTLAVEDRRYTARIEAPEGETDEGVLVVPGISSGPWGGIFDGFAAGAVEAGVMVLRFESWETPAELQEKSLGGIHREIDAAVELLRERGCSTVSVVGKSFGGGVVLTHVPDYVAKIVLWAPTIGVGEESNVSQWLEKELGEAEELTDIRVGHAYLDGLDIPVKLLHGTDDPIMPLSNSEEICRHIKNASLVEISGAQHSYTEEAHKEQVITETLQFLTDSLRS